MHSGPFGRLTKLGAKRAELVQKFVPRSRIGIFRKRTHPILPIGPYTDVLVRFVLFGCIRDCWAELVQKFVPRSRIGFFRNEHTRYSPLDPKIMFWCVSYYLGAFGTVWLPYETRCKTFRTSAKKIVPQSRLGFFHKRTHPILPIGP